MPIRPGERARYPKEWPAISRRIRDRAGQRCECTGQCGDVHDDSLYGQRCDAPNGEHILRHIEKPWRFITSLQFEKREALHIDECEWADRAVQIVLTVAHLDHAPENCAEENLLAMCQRCHLCMDSELHQRNARATRRAHKADRDLFDDIPTTTRHGKGRRQ